MLKGIFQRSKTEMQGFTLIELLVVLSIMSLIGFGIIANYAGTRSARNLHIAQNELVTNLRKAQSYSLSSRNLPNGTAAQYYILKFDATNPGQYVLQGLYNVNSSPAHIQNVETVPLPQGISLSNFSVNGSNTAGCLLVAFQLPFANVLANTSCTGGPPDVVSTDDYQKIINFIVNNSATTVSSDSTVVITVRTQSGTLGKVLVNGITGVVCPTQNGTACVASY